MVSRTEADGVGGTGLGLGWNGKFVFKGFGGGAGGFELSVAAGVEAVPPSLCAFLSDKISWKDLPDPGLGEVAESSLRGVDPIVARRSDSAASNGCASLFG